MEDFRTALFDGVVAECQGQVALFVDLDFVEAGEGELDLIQVRAGLDFEIVFDLVVGCCVVDEIDSLIQALVADLG